MSGDREKYGYRWIEMLRELPGYRSAVEKLLQQWSLDRVTDWIMEQPDRGPFTHLKRSTVRYYLNALNISLRDKAHAEMKKQQTLRAQKLNQMAEEFAAGLTQGTEGVVQQPELTEEEKRAKQEQHLESMIDELNSDRLVRLTLKIHLRHVALLEEIEEVSKKPAHGWERSMHILLEAAAILQKNEAARMLFESQMQKPNAIPAPQQSEEAKRVAKFSQVDINLTREAAEKGPTLVKPGESQRFRETTAEAHSKH